MSFKKVVYSLGQILVDTIMLFAIYLASTFLVGNTSINENFVFLITLFTVFKVVSNICVRNYRLYWVYQLTRNYVRLLFTSLLSIIIVISVNNVLFSTIFLPFILSNILLSLFIRRFNLIIEGSTK